MSKPLASSYLCKYSYKKCPNPRTIKRNGKLHTLCEYHRGKANTLQQGYAKRKKDRRKAKAGGDSNNVLLITASHGTTSWLDQIDFSRQLVMTNADCEVLLELLGS
ncbi:hypothetical protein H257_08963 [Aphanomyces astaci]|uniref:Uncharacterized protein n=1 Tax=Aphanomyces astaci TaxID=112090 RepID=W4GBN1_APHAT|nr:hypothetical protein H257_08963 [Aphanomyces astaci]ETV77055.1 hypothetical protein H257_08963 [Aphanomyces astaci]|eukprot:XP_009833361.1 hypothetical protein H257_08963 [Aphanomyces astaci]